MTPTREPYYFSGSAIGAAVRFHRLDDVHDLDHVIPTLGSSVLAVTGGISKSGAENFCFGVDHPRKRHLLSVRKIDVSATGREKGDRYETEVEGVVDSIAVVEHFQIDRLTMHLLSVRDRETQEVKTTSTGTAIEGLRLGSVEAKITLDQEPLGHCATKHHLQKFFDSQSEDYRKTNKSRFEVPSTHPPAAAARTYRCTLVRDIKLSGPEKDLQKLSVQGNTIIWDGFGRVILAEVFASDNARRLTMVRLAMGSDAGGSGTILCGQSNGQVGAG